MFIVLNNSASYPTPVVSHGNIYHNATPFSGSSTIALNEVGDGYVNNSGTIVALANVVQVGNLSFASLPASCPAGQEYYCSDCKSVADGVTMASTCVGSGTG